MKNPEPRSNWTDIQKYDVCFHLFFNPTGEELSFRGASCNSPPGMNDQQGHTSKEFLNLFIMEKLKM